MHIAVVGYGYWGPNLVRNFNEQHDCSVQWICDVSEERLRLASSRHSGVRVTTRYEDILGDASVDAVVIATPVSLHYPQAKAALQAGKDVLVEKPMTATAGESLELLNLAQAKGRVLGVDHTFLYTGAVRKIKETIDSGQLGAIRYIDSVRINLGLFSPDVNVIHDLAPHDIAITLHVLGMEPLTVQAVGALYGSHGNEYLAHLHLTFPRGIVAHFHLNWLSPIKVRQMLIAGEQKMIVYDDLDQSDKIKIYDKGIEIRQDDALSQHKIRVDYRTGDMVAPKISLREALHYEAEHFLECIRQRRQPMSDGKGGLAVVRVLEAAQHSLAGQGRPVRLDEIAGLA